MCTGQASKRSQLDHLSCLGVVAGSMERHELVAFALHVVHLVTAARQSGVKGICQQGKVRNTNWNMRVMAIGLKWLVIEENGEESCT